MVTAGVGGPISGRGGDVMVADDLIKNWQDAHSMQVKEVLWDWWHSTFLTRLEPGGTVIIAMTRWSDDDICAKLVEEDPGRWRVFRLPALAEPGDYLSRSPGLPLLPERYGLAELQQIQKEKGSAVWDALYQQRPQSFSSGRLYSHASERNIDATVYHPGWPLHLTFDFNVNPGMHVLVCQQDEASDSCLVLHEIHSHRLVLEGALVELDNYIHRIGHVGEVHIFGDATGSAKWSGTGQSHYDLINRWLSSRGYKSRLRYPASNPAIVDRLVTVNEALRDTVDKVHVIIHPQCVRLIEDLKQMKANEFGLIDKNEELLSHSSDAIGYWLCMVRPMWREKTKAAGRVGV